MGNVELKNAVDRFTAAVINRTSLGYGTVAVNSTVSIPANTTQEYNLATILSANPNNFDYKASVITVKVLDTDPNSPTVNTYIDAHTVVSAGISVGGGVKLHNHTGQTLECYVRIDVPYAPAP